MNECPETSENINHILKMQKELILLGEFSCDEIGLVSNNKCVVVKRI